MEASATSKSQLYHYFCDKDALMRAVIEFQTRRVTGGEVVNLEAFDSIDKLRRWRDGIVAMNKAARGVGGCPLGSLASELADRSESAREMLAHGFALWESHLVTGLRVMRDRGALRPEAKPEDLATTVIAALQGGLLLAQTRAQAGRSNSRSTWRSTTSRAFRAEKRRQFRATINTLMANSMAVPSRANRRAPGVEAIICAVRCSATSRGGVSVFAARRAADDLQFRLPEDGGVAEMRPAQ